MVPTFVPIAFVPVGHHRAVSIALGRWKHGRSNSAKMRAPPCYCPRLLIPTPFAIMRVLAFGFDLGGVILRISVLSCRDTMRLRTLTEAD